MMKSFGLALCLSICAGIAARGDTRPSAWLAETRERIASVFAGMEGDFHRERLEMRLAAAERLAAFPDRSPLEEAELSEFRASFDEAFGMWARDPLNPAARPVELNLADFIQGGASSPSEPQRSPESTANAGEPPALRHDAAFARAIEAVRALDGAPSILRIPAGDYLLAGVAPGRVIPRGKFHLDLSGLTNCAVVGESPETTRIEFGTYGHCGISIDGSENCSLVALDLAWRDAMFSQVTVESYDPADFSAVVRHHPATLPPTALDPDDGHTHVCALFSSDGKFLRDRGNLFNFYGKRRAEDLGGGLFRIWFDETPHYSQDIRNFRPQMGDVITVVDRMNTQMAIRTSSSAYCSFHRVWIRNSPAGTICGATARYLTMDHCKVFPKSPDLCLSSNADTGYCPFGTHIAHSEFRNMSDDGANCLGYGAHALRREGARSLVIRPLLGRLRPGDFQQIVGADGRILDLRVVEIRVVEEESRNFPGMAAPTRGRWVVTYDRDLPGDIVTEADIEAGTATRADGRTPKPDVVFTLLEWGTGFTMRDNYIHDFRGRGLCLQCPHAIVEDNVFENMIDGIDVAGRLAFREGPISSDILLRRNTIRDTRTGIHVYYLDAYGARLEGEKDIHRIEIVSNRFERVEKPFDLRNAGEVAIRGNIVENLVE